MAHEHGAAPTPSDRGSARTRRPRHVALRDLASDWRRWSTAERIGTVAIAAAWLGGLSSALVFGAG